LRREAGRASLKDHPEFAKQLILHKIYLENFPTGELFPAIVPVMSKSSVQKVRSAAKNARVSAKKSVKLKSARRSAPAKSGRGASKGAKTAKSASKAVTGKTAAKAASKVAAKATVKTSVKATAKTVRSIAEAMKAAKAARFEPVVVKPRIVPSPAVQPYVPPVEIKTHKFEVGQVVYYNAPTFGRAPAPGNFTVVKLLPSDGDEHQYRIKSNGEAFERVAKESQLDLT
jgi:hypothetical protein